MSGFPELRETLDRIGAQRFAETKSAGGLASFGGAYVEQKRPESLGDLDVDGEWLKSVNNIDWDRWWNE